MKLSVLMPVYNESRTLRTIIARVLEAPVDMEIELVCVDDHSSDDSLEILHDLARQDDRIKVIAQPNNMGKGRAIRTAIDAVTGDIAIVQDSDLEYSPSEYPRVLAPIIEGRADAVYGSRFAASEQRRVLFFWHSLGNKLLTLMSNMANDLNLTDMETCYKAVRADLLKGLRLTSDRFGFEPEVTARLAKSGARIYEVPISYHGRTYAEGKNIGWRDGLEALWLILKFRFIDTHHSRDNRDAGRATLESLATAPSVARWALEQFEPYLGDEVLEVGCGPGNLTRFLIGRKRLVSLDIEESHVADLALRYGHLEGVTIELGDLDESETFDGMDGDFDSVLCVNVLEHLSRPDVAIRGFKQALRTGGYLLLLVPAHDALHSPSDDALGHHRRYGREDLESALAEADMDLVEIRQFNRLGVLGWLINKWLHRTYVSGFQVRIFKWMLPLARILERFPSLPGLSWVAVARKRQE